MLYKVDHVIQRSGLNFSFSAAEFVLQTTVMIYTRFNSLDIAIRVKFVTISCR